MRVHGDTTMKVSGSWLQRQTVLCLIFLLAVPFTTTGTAFPQQTPSGQQSQSAPNQSQNSSPSQPDALPAAPQSTQEQQNGGNQPLGTAVAPVEKPVGVAASRPAGAAIAPAKQKRARSFVIKVGVVVAAAVAVGTVVALSSGSPSRPQ